MYENYMAVVCLSAQVYLDQGERAPQDTTSTAHVLGCLASLAVSLCVLYFTAAKFYRLASQGFEVAEDPSEVVKKPGAAASLLDESDFRDML